MELSTVWYKVTFSAAEETELARRGRRLFPAVASLPFFLRHLQSPVSYLNRFAAKWHLHHCGCQALLRNMSAKCLMMTKWQQFYTDIFGGFFYPEFTFPSPSLSFVSLKSISPSLPRCTSPFLTINQIFTRHFESQPHTGTLHMTSQPGPLEPYLHLESKQNAAYQHPHLTPKGPTQCSGPLLSREVFIIELTVSWDHSREATQSRRSTSSWLEYCRPAIKAESEAAGGCVWRGETPAGPWSSRPGRHRRGEFTTEPSRDVAGSSMKHQGRRVYTRRLLCVKHPSSVVWFTTSKTTLYCDSNPFIFFFLFYLNLAGP